MTLLFALLFLFGRDAALALGSAQAEAGQNSGSDDNVVKSAIQTGAQKPSEPRTLKVKLKRKPLRSVHYDHKLRGTHQHRHSFVQLGSEVTASSRTKPMKMPSEIFGTVYVGSPPLEFTVAFDTASGNLVLPSSKCKEVACLSHQPYDETMSGTGKAIGLLDDPIDAPAPGPGGDREVVTVSVGSGSASGELVTDTVCLDQQQSVCAPTAFIAADKMSDKPFLLLPYDGILGLGMPHLSLQKRFNILGNIADEHLLKRNQFAIWLANDDDKEDSEITFGSIDGDRLGSELMWLPVSSGSTGMWQVNMKDFKIGNTSLGICPEQGCQVALDTGTIPIAGVSSVLKMVKAELNVKEDCTNYDKLPLLGFDFGEYVLYLEKSDYVTQNGGTHCHGEFFELDMPPPKGPLILLGDAFLRRFYTIYDRSSMRIGLGLAKHKKPSAIEDETTEEAAQRLMVAQTKPSD